MASLRRIIFSAENVDISDRKHVELDEAFFSQPARERWIPPPRDSLLGSIVLLTIMNQCSKSYEEIGWPIKPMWRDPDTCQNLLQDLEHPVWDLLEKRDFKSVRQMDVFHVPPPSQPDNALIVPDWRTSAATLRAWDEKYVGNVSTFLRYVMGYLDPDPRKPIPQSTTLELYAHYLSFANSTGTGKSRTSDQLSKIRFVIPICLRDPEETGFPPPDTEVRRYFLQTEDNSPVAPFRAYLAFLRSTFEEVTRMLKADEGGLSTRNAYGTNCWNFREWMCEGQMNTKTGPNRTGFWSKVVERADRYQQATEPPAEDELDTTLKADAARMISNMDAEDKGGVNDWELQMTIYAFGRLTRALKNKDFPKNDKEPLVYLSFDEAHVLTPDRKDSKARPASFTRFSELRRALRSLNSYRLFSIFLSTTGSIYQFNPGRLHDKSKRYQDGRFSLIPPYTDFGFDHIAAVCRDGDEPSLLDIAKISRLVTLGRPLFSTRYMHGDLFVKTRIIEFAAEKLICAAWPLPNGVFLSDGQKLACLSARLALSFTSVSDGKAIAAAQVEKHMRICIASEDPRHELVTISASEPVVAEGARRVMAGAYKIFDPAASLASLLLGPLISTGARGELIAELLLLLAFDIAIQNLRPSVLEQPSEPFRAASSVPSGPPTVVRKEEGARSSHATAATAEISPAPNLSPQDETPIANGDTNIPDVPAMAHDAKPSTLPDEAIRIGLQGYDAPPKADDPLPPEMFPENDTLPVICVVDFVHALFPQIDFDTVEPTVILGDAGDSDSSQTHPTLAEAFKDGKVFFNHFIQFRSCKMVNRGFLHSLFLRCAAGICSVGQAAIDLIIPVLFGDKLKVENISCILVQVKLVKKLNNIDVQLFHDIDPFTLGVFPRDSDSNDVPPVIRIVLSLGSESSYVRTGPFDMGKAEHEQDGQSDIGEAEYEQDAPKRKRVAPHGERPWKMQRVDEIRQAADREGPDEEAPTIAAQPPVKTRARKAAPAKSDLASSRRTQPANKVDITLAEQSVTAPGSGRQLRSHTKHMATTAAAAGPSKPVGLDDSVGDAQPLPAPKRAGKTPKRAVTVKRRNTSKRDRTESRTSAQLPVESRKRTSAKASSGKAFVAYDIWSSGLDAYWFGPVDSERQLSWKNLLRASYGSWNSIHEQKKMWGAEAESRSMDPAALPHPFHFERFDKVALKYVED